MGLLVSFTSSSVAWRTKLFPNRIAPGLIAIRGAVSTSIDFNGIKWVAAAANNSNGKAAARLIIHVIVVTSRTFFPTSIFKSRARLTEEISVARSEMDTAVCRKVTFLKRTVR